MIAYVMVILLYTSDGITTITSAPMSYANCEARLDGELERVLEKVKKSWFNDSPVKGGIAYCFPERTKPEGAQGLDRVLNPPEVEM